MIAALDKGEYTPTPVQRVSIGFYESDKQAARDAGVDVSEPEA